MAQGVTDAVVGGMQPGARVASAAAANISAIGGADAASQQDSSVGGPPIFLPYTPPKDVQEVPVDRTQNSRTLANPDGSFTQETSAGPINFQDSNGAWQPIDLSLVADKTDAFAYRVAATDGTVRFGTDGAAIASLDVGGYKVTLGSPDASTGTIGLGLTANEISFGSLPSGPAVFARPLDVGVEFGASWANATQSPVATFTLATGDLRAVLDEDGQTVLFFDPKGNVVGRIEVPVLREGGEDGPPILTETKVALAPAAAGGYTLSYSVDPQWFTAKERTFPILLDPAWCMGAGADSSCDHGTGQDSFIFSANPDSYEVGWTTMRVGYDVRSDDGDVYGTMRGLVWFDTPALPDGYVVYDTNLQLHIGSEYGGPSGETISAYRLTKALTSHYTWTKFNNTYTTTDPAGISVTVPSSGYMNFDVDGIVHSWYTRQPKDWRTPYGFMIKMASEGSSHGEVEFSRYTNGTTAYRPLLTITYTQPKVGIDFDPRLGSMYAPSNMVANVPTKVPVVVLNKTGSDGTLLSCATDANRCWKVGYRWFDAKGNLVGGGTSAATVDMPDDVAVGGQSANPFALTVTPPATTGEYTLRLDLIHYYFGTYAWSSDYATPSKYYSRNKKILSTAYTRWTGSSAIERDEFGVNVVSGVGGGNVQSVKTGTGDSLGIDLFSRNLSYSGNTGLGFTDRIPLALTYGYNESNATGCAGYLGILNACGWFTNYDERIVGGSNQTGFDYTYTGPDGVSSMLDTDGDGQIVGGAPVLVNRQRITVIDENGGWDGSDADTLPDVQAVVAASESPSFSAYAGQLVGKAPSGANTGLNFPDKLNLNAYRRVRFALRTTPTSGALSSGLCFYIHNVSDSTKADSWFCYTVGSAWTPGSGYTKFIALGAPNGPLNGTVWNFYDHDLYGDILANGTFGASTDDYQVTKIQVQSAGANSYSTYVDAFRFESQETPIVEDSNLSWTSGSSSVTVNSNDKRVGTASLQIAAGSGITPTCRTTVCWSTSAGALWAYGFTDWYWKKVGGDSAAMVFYLHDNRSGAPCNSSDCALLYYAGAAPGLSGVNASIQISPTLPTTWTLVRRNLIEDARQALNLYDDDASATPDDVRMTGFAPVAVNGSYLLLDHMAYGSLTDIGSTDPTDTPGNPLTMQTGHPNAPGDPTFTYDFTADYPDGSRHYFNRDGLLVQIRDRDGNAVRLDWTYDNTKAGPAAYRLDAVRAPGDGAVSGSTTFMRRFTVTRGTDGAKATTRFDEDLGQTGSGGDVSNRAAVFEVSGSDLVAVSPARTQVSGGANGPFCAPSSLGNGCDQFAYQASGLPHRLQFVADPRWDGTTTSGAGNLRFEIGLLGSDPGSIKDLTRGGTGGTALLNVLTYNDTRDGTLVYNRPLWQDAAAGAAGYALAADLGPDGQALTTYAPRQCGDSACATLPDTAGEKDYKAVEYQFDGLHQINQTKTFRCPKANYPAGCTSTTELVAITRTGTMASAKVDNYSDPLAGGRTAWSETADEVFASLRDSNGANADLYRTEFTYDGSGQISEQVEVRQLDTGNYPDYVKLNAPLAYWRLNEASGGNGSTMADSSGLGHGGTYTTVPTLDQTGALVRDPSNVAAKFNGSTQYATATYAQLGSPANPSAYSVEAWVNSATATANQSWVGSRGTSDYGFDAKFCQATCTGGKGIRVDVGTGTVWLLNGTVPFDWQTNRWYDVVVVVDSGADTVTVYVDGAALGRLAFTTAGTGILTNSSHNLYVGKNGLTTTPEWFSGSIDDVAVYLNALQPSDVVSHWRAGRAVLGVDTTTQRDGQGRPVETSTQFVSNPGFEQGSTGWSLNGGTVTTADHAGGFASLSLATTAAQQVVQLVPGQTARVQVSDKVVSGASVHATIEYWQTSTGTWAGLLSSSPDYADGTFTGHAYEVTLPFDTDGRLRLSLARVGSGTAYVDDVLVVTHWSKTAYDTSSSGVLYGRTTDTFALRSCASGACSTPTADTNFSYLAGTASPALYPAIFPTQTVQNYTGGSQTADTDVTSLTWFDAWGRTTQTQDPDGVLVTTSFAANQTDVATTEDTVGYLTSMAYDPAGHLLSTTTPLGHTTSMTYDLAGHRIDLIAPDNAVTRTDYDNYGQAIRVWSNHTQAESPSADHDLLTKFTVDELGHVTKQELDCGSTANCATGLDATSTADYDLGGNPVATRVYPLADGGGTARTTTKRFETLTLPTTSPFYVVNQKLSRMQSSGEVLPIASTMPNAPTCPDGAGLCNTVSQVDVSGRPTSLTDAYGVLTRLYLDVDGRTVKTVANSTTQPDDHLNDQNVTSINQYDSLGQVAIAWLPIWSGYRSDVNTYDALGRVVSVAHRDATTPNPVTVNTVTTTYTAGGRTSSVNDGSSTTQTVYDDDGRALETVANADTAGNAGMSIEAFEGRLSSAWQSTASGTFTTVAATSVDPTLDASVHPASVGGSLAPPARDYGNEYTSVPPVSGRGRLHVSSSAVAGSGVWWDLSGQTYQGTHTYKVAFDARSSSSVTLHALLGQDIPGGSKGELGSIGADGAWHRYAFTWTPSSSVSGNIHFALRVDSTGSAEVYLDNVVIWDTTNDGTTDWKQKGIVSSITAYDADGKISASILPPGDPDAVPAGETELERPLVTTVAADPAGRNVATVVNDVAGSYAATVRGTANLAAYVPLDETTGLLAADQGGGTVLTNSALPDWGVAGAIDEGRTAARFTGTNGFFGRVTAATSATTNVTMEGWIRSDTTPTDGQTHVISANGDVNNGWGLAIDGSGNAAGFVVKSNNPGAGFYTLASSTKVTDGAWHHLVLTRTTTTWTLYVDKATPAISNNTKNPGTPGASFSIGAASDGSSAFVGDIDEISVYNANLSSSTVGAHYDAGRHPATDNKSGLATRTNYDGLGRAIDKWTPTLVPLLPLGAIVVPQRTHGVLDRLGNQIETWENYQVGVAATATGDVNLRSTFGYDVLGELTGYCSARWVFYPGCSPTSGSDTNAWYYTFTDMGKAWKTIPPVMSTNTALTTTENVYDSGGHEIKVCRYPAGASCGSYNSRHTDMAYDALGRVSSQVSWDRAASPAADTAYYTKNLTWNFDGSQATVSEGSQTLTWIYDSIGRLSQFKDGSSVKTAFTYNTTTGTVATRTDGTMGTTSFTYDWAKRETKVTPPSGYTTSFVTRAYRLDGTLAGQSFQSSLSETLAYDAVKRPASISLGAAGSLSQTYDRGGRVTSEGRGLTGVSGDPGTGTQSFSYDGASRILGASGLSKTYTYAYDLDSDRLTRSDGTTNTSFSYDRAGEIKDQTIGSTTKTFAYDAFGNLTTAADDQSNLTSYGYDKASRMTSITPSSGSAATIAVDALDRPKTRTVGLTTDTYGYLGSSSTSYETGNASTDALLDLDGSRLAVKTGGTVSWVVFDLHGSIVALCPAGSTTLSDAYRYDPWGQSYPAAGSTTNPWRYRGLLDVSPNGQQTGGSPLYAMGARFYAPNLGAFTQEDSNQGSAIDPKSMNRFLYAAANPTTLIDPDGHRYCTMSTFPDDCDGWSPNMTQAEKDAIWDAYVCRTQGEQCPAAPPDTRDHGGDPNAKSVTFDVVDGVPVLPNGTFANPTDVTKYDWCGGPTRGPRPDVCTVWVKTKQAMLTAQHNGQDPNSIFATPEVLDVISDTLKKIAESLPKEYKGSITLVSGHITAWYVWPTGEHIGDTFTPTDSITAVFLEESKFAGFIKGVGSVALVLSTVISFVDDYNERLDTEHRHGTNEFDAQVKALIAGAVPAGGGLGAGVAAGIACNAALDIETLGAGAVFCIAVGAVASWGAEQILKGWVNKSLDDWRDIPAPDTGPFGYA